jgi:tetratricopeptide (TPR) repeat protein
MIEKFLSFFRGESISLIPPPDLEKAMNLFFGGNFEEALLKVSEFEENASISEIDRLQAILLRSYILVEKGDPQKGLEKAEYVSSQSKKIEHPLLLIDSYYIEILSHFKEGNHDQGQEIISELKGLIKSTRNISKSEKKKRLAIADYHYARIFRKRGEVKKALSFLNKALPVIEKLGNKYELANILNEIGISSSFKGDSDSALRFFKASLDVFDELDNSSSMIKLLNNIGQIFWQRGDLDQALTYYHRAQKISEEVGNLFFSAVLLLNIGLIIEGRGELDSALEYFQRSLKSFEDLGRHDEVAICINNIGRIYQVKGELDLALQHYERSLSYFEEKDNKHEMAACDSNIGFLYQLKGEYMEAAAYLSKTLVIQEEIGNPLDLAKTLQHIIENYVNAGAKESADHYLDRLQQINDQEDNKLIEQQYCLVKALVLKMSGRVVHRAEAQNLLTKIANSEILNHEVTVDAMLNLFELLLFELRTTGNKEVLLEVKALSEKLLTIAQSQKSFARLAQVYRLQSKLALLELEIKRSQHLLTQAQLIAETKGLNRLAQAISNEFDSLLNDMSKWEDFIERKASITERYELAELETMMAAVLKRRASEFDDLPEEDPLMVLILDDAGLSLYSRNFGSGDNVRDQMIGGLLTAINAFMQEAFSISGSIERIKHQDNTLLLKHVEPYLFSYVFQGQSYSALQKLDRFIEHLRTSDLWTDIGKIRSTGRTDQVRTALDQATSEVFV